MAFEYIVKGEVIRLPVNPDKISVRFREPSGPAERREVIDPKPEVGSYDDRFEVPNEKLTVVDTIKSDQPGDVRVAAAVGALNADPEVERVSPVFEVGTKHVVVPDRIVVGFKPGTGENVAAEVVGIYGGELLEQLAEGREFIVRLPASTEPFDVIASLTKHAEVDYAEPDFITIGQHLMRSTPLDEGGHDPGPVNSGSDNPDMPAANASEVEDAAEAGPAAPGIDPFLKFQYAARITRAAEAWQLAGGAPAIKIAIIDEGVDATHPDLSGCIVKTFDAIDNDPQQQPNPWDTHGTACAGLAAATPNNARGIRGMGGGCSLMTVRIAFSAQPGARWTVVEGNVIKGIEWAWRNGADILSNSWIWGVPSNAIINALERARTLGRQGRGCVIVMAAGNDSGAVAFPATLPNVLTVSASNEFDEPKTRISADGEKWWGSNFGREVDVAAPGVHNFTTDIAGAGGANPGGGTLDPDYVSNFNGTSSSTPIVAGIAGLVLSVKPTLREEQVRRLLKTTADKVGHVVYANGRNDQMGDGRVNALRAVQTAPSFV
jgi:subtilisin family serine protease